MYRQTEEGERILAEGRPVKYLLLKDARQIRRVAVQNIVCCEAQKKQQYIYMTDGTQLIQHETMTRLYEMLSGCPEIVKVGVAWLVNLEHVESLTAREIQLDCGRTIYLPRGAYQTLRERYFQYYSEESREIMGTKYFHEKGVIYESM